MSQQNFKSSPQQGLQTRQQPGNLQRAVPVTGTLTRLSDHVETKTLTTWNPDEAALWIEEAEQKGHVVAPSMMPVFPHGRGVAVSIVRITDFNKQGTQLYPIQGSNNLALHKNVLDEIGRGYAIDWPPQWTFREPFTLPGALEQDPRDNDPWCIKITVCGRFKKFDGTWSTLPALTKEIDLREGSAEVMQIRVRQEDSALKELPPNPSEDGIAKAKGFAKKKADAEIAQLRKFIRAHAQTKARLQVIGTLVRRSYSLEELRKPFFVFSSVWTGRSENLEIDMMLAKGALEMEKEGRALLFGGTGVAEPKQLPPAEDKPYNVDVELEAYEKAMASGEAGDSTVENVTGQGDVAGSSASVQGDSASNQPTQKQCTTESGCLGMEPGVKHILACYGKGEASTEQSTATGQSAATEEQPWILQQGPAKNLAVNDAKVTATTLIQMEHELAAALKPNGLLYDQLSPEKKDLISQELRKIGQELDRRKITEGRLKQ